MRFWRPALLSFFSFLLLESGIKIQLLFLLTPFHLILLCGHFWHWEGLFIWTRGKGNIKKHVFVPLSPACAIWEITLFLLLKLHLNGRSRSLWFCVSSACAGREYRIRELLVFHVGTAVVELETQLLPGTNVCILF